MHILFFSLPYLLLCGIWILVIGWLAQISDWQTIFYQLEISWWMIAGIGLSVIGLSLFPNAWQVPDNTIQEKKTKSLLIHLLALTILLSLFWLLYHQVLTAWWSFDDPDILRYVHTHGPWVGFFDPSKKYNFYAPLQNFSWWIDYQLFGFNPKGFYWHHLLSISAIVILAYMVLNTFFSPLISMMIVSLFIVLVPTAQVTHYLMVRHYVEGLIFALLATWIYIHAVKQDKWLLSILGSCVYFLAALGKELYVPLSIALLLLPIGTFKTRIRLLIPYIIFTAVYTVIRIYMLGQHTFSAYPQDSTTWHDIIYFPIDLIQIMGWEQVWQWLPILGIVMVLGILIVHKPISFGVYTLGWLLCILLPLVPIFWRISMVYYYLFVVGLFVAIGVGIALHHLTDWLDHFAWHKALINSLFLTLLLASLLPAQVEQLHLKTIMQTNKIQGEALLYEQSPSTVLIYDYHVASSLIYLREQVLKQPNGIAWCPKEDCTCMNQYFGYTAKKYVNGKWQTNLLLNNCDNDDKNLSVVINLVSHQTLQWQFGPYPQEQGQYFVYFFKQYENSSHWYLDFTSPITPKGTFTQPIESIKFIIKYTDSKGWETHSPLFELSPSKNNIAWQRKR